jgi:NAD(P)-dependent dehydrogenase (short-subunit alcohol dehydrogenase family)
MGLLEGKVVLVSGAAGGLGRAYSRLFAAEGALLVLNDNGVDERGLGADESRLSALAAELRGLGHRVALHPESVATSGGAEAFVKVAVEAFGRADVLVNNAGFALDRTLLRLAEDEVDRVFDVHAKGSLYATQSFARQVLAQGGGGRIVNTTSASGLLGHFGQASYSMASAAVYALTRTSSIELQKHRITVNAVAPLAKTRLTEALPLFQGVDTLTPEHVAPAVLFLASDACRDRTGHVLAVAGARVYALKFVESSGRFKEVDAGVWTAEEIAAAWDSIVKL